MKYADWFTMTMSPLKDAVNFGTAYGNLALVHIQMAMKTPRHPPHQLLFDQITPLENELNSANTNF